MANSFSYLECVSSGSKLILSSHQQMNGNNAIERMGTKDDRIVTSQTRGKASYK